MLLLIMMTTTKTIQNNGDEEHKTLKIKHMWQNQTAHYIHVMKPT
jgi:hypothetical protein